MARAGRPSITEAPVIGRTDPPHETSIARSIHADSDRATKPKHVIASCRLMSRKRAEQTCAAERSP
jgi:hypothetical protein